MKIVSFTGPRGCGKDTAANILKKEGIADGNISFAGPLKKICVETFKLHHNYFNDPNLKERPLTNPITLTPRIFRSIISLMMDYLDIDEFYYNPNAASIAGLDGRVLKTPREILQVIGTDWIRDRIHPDWHLRAAFSNKALSQLKPNGLYCVTDARFPNEYQFLAERFGEDFQGFYIERPEAEELLAQSSHSSELQVLEVKKMISPENILVNDGSIEDFKKKLLNLNLKAATSTKSKSSKFKFVRAGSRNSEGAF
jgi:hypothetical protein